MSVQFAPMESLPYNADLTAAPPLTAPDDNDLAAAAREGDQEAFQELFERHKHSVARLGYRFFSRREQVEDVIQDTFTKAYFALGSFRGVHERSFISWLSQIATRVCYDLLRRPQYQSEQLLSDLTENESEFLQTHCQTPEGERNAEESLLTRDLAGKLLSRLSSEDRLILTLLHGAEHSSAEIASLTGWSEGKVRVRALRARRSLQRILHKLI
jgi:RNA polymerase sigma-70 factor (ECF subfamily)